MFAVACCSTFLVRLAIAPWFWLAHLIRDHERGRGTLKLFGLPFDGPQGMASQSFSLNFDLHTLSQQANPNDILRFST